MDGENNTNDEILNKLVSGENDLIKSVTDQRESISLQQHRTQQLTSICNDSAKPRRANLDGE